MFVVKVDKNIAKIEEKEEITSGSQNVYVTQFQFSDEWQYLERTARFKAEDKIVDILLDDNNRCMIPWELMTKAKVSIEVGAYGVKDGNVVLPTIWASMPVILQSVLGEDDAAWPSEPTPDVYQQILARLGELEDKIDEGVTGVGSGQNGKDGKDGKSAYEIAVDNGFVGTETEWLASLQGSDADVIDRCVWIYAAGNDIATFANGETNVASPDEFVGHSPSVSSNNIGIILVNNKLYWTKFDITAANENSVTQVFTQNPIFIGPSNGSNISESTLFVGNYNRAPKPDDYFNITPDRIYGDVPKNGETYTLIMFTSDGVFDCTCVVTDYTPGKWAVQVKVTTASGVSVYSKEKIDEMLSEISGEGGLPTIKDTTITNLSQLPTDKLPCCFRMINSSLGMLYNDDIVYVRDDGSFLSVYTMNGAIVKLTIGSDGQLNLANVSYTATTEYVDNKINDIESESSFTPGETLTLSDNVLNVALPMKAVTQEEYDALTEEEQNADVVWLINTVPEVIPDTLNECSWDLISKLSKRGEFVNHFSVGDTKTITLNGNIGVGFTADNLEIDLVVVGINHNADLEGNNLVHFMLGKINGTNVALTDSKYDMAVSDYNYFSMNVNNTNTVGWAGSQMRSNIMGANGTPDEPIDNTLMSALPSDLRSVMRSAQKWTKNQNGVSFTSEYLCPPAEYEVFGNINYGYSSEATKQSQYAFFTNSNNRIMKMINNMSQGVTVLLRSPENSSGYDYCGIKNTGDKYDPNGTYSRGITPLLFV